MEINQFIIDRSCTVLQAMNQLDKSARRILFVCDGKKLKAAVTDGDIRRFVLKSGNLSDSVEKAANYKPKTLKPAQINEAKQFLKENKLDCVPIVNNSQEIISLVFKDESEVVSQSLDLPVVIMAGGLGTRLYPYTKILPKPLIPIGDKPILEHIIDRFCKYSCKDYYIVVNYKKNMIKAYFGEEKRPYSVNFVDEEKPLGTGGGLSLLKGRINGTFIFSNCDILLDADYADICSQHKSNGNFITMVCAVKNMTIPYGVVKTDESGSITEMKEKPSFSFLTNTGFYVAESRVIEELEDDSPVGFPDIIEKYRLKGEKIGVYPVGENQWMDMGQLEELDEMKRRIEIKP